MSQYIRPLLEFKIEANSVNQTLIYFSNHPVLATLKLHFIISVN